jgi:hypothetical protein
LVSFFQFPSNPVFPLATAINIGESVSLFTLWMWCTFVGTTPLQFECDVQHSWVQLITFWVQYNGESSLLECVCDTQHWWDQAPLYALSMFLKISGDSPLAVVCKVTVSPKINNNWVACWWSSLCRLTFFLYLTNSEPYGLYTDALIVLYNSDSIKCNRFS